MLYSSDYHNPGDKNMPGPTGVDDPVVPPVGDPSDEGPGKRPDDAPDAEIKLPERSGDDLIEDFPDPEDRDPNLLENEQMHDD